MMGDKQEFELKLELDEDGIAAVASNPVLAELAVRPPRQRLLRSTYFDTSDHVLHDAGISLRIREADGARVQTVKLGTAVRGGISNPREVEAPVAGMTPDADAINDEELRQKIEGLVDLAALKPVFRTEIERSEHRLAIDGTTAELALDIGQLQSPKKVRPISEAELELKSGEVDAFLELAERLFADVSIRFGMSSKAQKGYLLLSKAEAPPPVPAGASRPELEPDDDIATGFSKICRPAVDQILANWAGVLTSDDPEFAHQLRVGLRRLRSVLYSFEAAIDGEAMAALDAELGQIGRIVGALRNKDVMVADILVPAFRSTPQTTARCRLQELITSQCALERRRVRSELLLRRWNRLLLKLALLPFGAGWAGSIMDERSVAQYAAAALEQNWKKVKRRADRLDKLSDEKRHRLRKDLKIFRYGIESFASILPSEPYKSHVKQLKALQDSFGYLNDVALAKTLPDMLSGASADDPELAQTIGFVLGWHSARATRELAWAEKQWKRLRKQPKPWA